MHNRLSKKIDLLIFLLVIFILASMAFNLKYLHIFRTMEKNRQLVVGNAAPKFSAKDLNGRQWTVPQEQKSFLLIFFNTTCNSCRLSMPYIEKSYSQFLLKGIQIIGLCSSNIESTLSYRNSVGINFPVIADQKKNIFRKYKIHYVPTLIWIRGNKKIAHVQAYGESVKQSINLIIQKLGGINVRK